MGFVLVYVGFHAEANPPVMGLVVDIKYYAEETVVNVGEWAADITRVRGDDPNRVVLLLPEQACWSNAVPCFQRGGGIRSPFPGAHDAVVRSKSSRPQELHLEGVVEDAQTNIIDTVMVEIDAQNTIRQDSICGCVDDIRRSALSHREQSSPCCRSRQGVSVQTRLNVFARADSYTLRWRNPATFQFGPDGTHNILHRTIEGRWQRNIVQANLKRACEGKQTIEADEGERGSAR